MDSRLAILVPDELAECVVESGSVLLPGCASGIECLLPRLLLLRQIAGCRVGAHQPQPGAGVAFAYPIRGGGQREALVGSELQLLRQRQDEAATPEIAHRGGHFDSVVASHLQAEGDAAVERELG